MLVRQSKELFKVLTVINQTETINRKDNPIIMQELIVLQDIRIIPIIHNHSINHQVKHKLVELLIFKILMLVSYFNTLFHK